MTFITDSTFNILLLAWLGVGIIAFVYLFFQTAPYGKHVSKGWGPEISAKAGWIIEECPAFFLMLIYFLIAGDYTNPVHVWSATCAVIILIEVSLANASSINDKKMPLMVVFLRSALIC